MIILSDLIFNHSQHTAMLRSCQEALAPGGSVYVIFSSHRPWLAEKDKVCSSAFPLLRSTFLTPVCPPSRISLTWRGKIRSILLSRISLWAGWTPCSRTTPVTRKSEQQFTDIACISQTRSPPPLCEHRSFVDVLDLFWIFRTRKRWKKFLTVAIRKTSDEGFSSCLPSFLGTMLPSENKGRDDMRPQISSHPRGLPTLSRFFRVSFQLHLENVLRGSRPLFPSFSFVLSLSPAAVPNFVPTPSPFYPVLPTPVFHPQHLIYPENLAPELKF